MSRASGVMLTLDLADPQTNANPFPTLARLRDEDPVHWSPILRAWFVTRYEDVRAITLNNRELSADRLTPFFRTPSAAGKFHNLRTYLNHWMVFRDPPDHTRLRRLFTKVFTPSAVAALHKPIERTVASLIDAMERKAKAGEAVDWIADFCYPLPATVIMDMLGVPREDIDRVKVWSDDIALFIGSSQVSADKYDRAEAGVQAMADFFRDLVAQRTTDPQHDLVSRLVMARDEQETMTADEVISTCILLLFAGHETTTNMIGNGFYHSMQFRDQWERLANEPQLIPSAVEEWLRFDGPSATIARVVAHDFEFAGKPFKKGQRVFAFLNSANRDGEQFADPDTLDFGRNPNPHLAFGNGIHFCLGAPLARLETQIALKHSVERFPDIQLLDGEPTWNDSLVLRGIKSLPVKLRSSPPQSKDPKQ